MTTLPAFTRTAILPTPSLESLSRLLEETAADATHDFQNDYARRSGYAVGPQGEWISELRPAA
jgi:hypothetical protein